MEIPKGAMLLQPANQELPEGYVNRGYEQADGSIGEKSPFESTDGVLSIRIIQKV